MEEKGGKEIRAIFRLSFFRNLSGNAPAISANAPKKMRVSFDIDIKTFML